VSGQDWHLDLVDGKFLFLNIPKTATAILQDTPLGQSNLLLGMVKKDGFMPIPWVFGTLQGRDVMATAFGATGYQTMEKLYRVAMAAHGNFLSKATINASMQVRMVLHRLQGRNVHSVQEMIKPGKGRG